MEKIREYLIGVVVAALLCGIFTSLAGTKGTIGASVKLMASILMLLSVIRPWTNISLNGFLHFGDGFTQEATDYVASGQCMALESYRQSIISQTQAYILDEAKALGCNIQVEVFLTEDNPPVPMRVQVTGEVSPYARRTLTNFIAERLGIGQEDQIWT